MIHTRNATLIHFKQSKLSAECIIDCDKEIGWAILMFVQSYFHPSAFDLNKLKSVHLYK